MSLTVYTARIDYVGADRLDVTRVALLGAVDGRAFAPSRQIVSRALLARSTVVAARKSIATAECKSNTHFADASREVLARVTADYAAEWLRFVEAYTEEMRVSYRTRPGPWARLLARSRVVLVCFCDVVTWPSECHRVVLARDILPRLGATYGGEVTS